MATRGKRLKLVDPGNCSANTKLSLNWDLCIVCQKQTSIKLQCPNNSKRGDVGAGYRTFAANFAAFKAANAVPAWVRFRLDDDVDMVEALVRNNAKWHKSCVDSINATKLQRVERRVVEMEDHNFSDTAQLLEEGSALTMSCSTRSSFSTLPECSTPCCFFCTEHVSDVTR
jgi:hypothetical protein